MGRVSPNYYVQDGVVPRTRLPEVLGRIRELEERSGLRIGNVFHAGDGNLHPLICYDERVPGRGRSRRGGRGARSSPYCIEAGGSLTGEHGVGADKAASMPKMFTADDLDADAARPRARSTRASCAIPARSFRRRGCAAKSPGRIAAIRRGRGSRGEILNQ